MRTAQPFLLEQLELSSEGFILEEVARDEMGMGKLGVRDWDDMEDEDV